MKNILVFFCLLTSAYSFAGDGYQIKIKTKNTTDTLLYLAHYFGKPFPTIFKADSARVNKNGIANFTSKEKITGGIYLILPSDRKSYFEFLLNNGDKLNMEADLKSNPVIWTAQGSKDNADFNLYQKEMEQFGKKQQGYIEALSKASNSTDSNRIKKSSADDVKALYQYRRDYATANPNTLLTHIFNALETPQIPEGKHYLSNGHEDSNFVYHYYKNHFWDGFDYNDDRLIHTPLLQQKLDEYFNKLVLPIDDSVIAEADIFLAKIKNSENLFKFTLNWLSTNAQESKVMGMDKVFVHLVENYYAHGQANWLSEEDLAKYIKRAGEIAPNVVGNPAKNFTMQDGNGVYHSLNDVKAKYTLLIFWSPDCGHCIHEIPIIDSVYRAALKAKGVKVFAVTTENKEDKWKAFIAKHHLEEWTNVWDPQYKSGYWQWYDVKTTPYIFLLDENKIIRGKKLDHTTISKVIEIIEHKEKMSKN